MRFPHRRAKTARRSSDDRTTGPYPDDQADWRRPSALGDRACCCAARPVIRVLIPPASARPHSVDLLLCGHHYRTSRVALAAAGALIMDDWRRGGTGVSEPAQAEPAPDGTTRRR